MVLAVYDEMTSCRHSVIRYIIPSKRNEVLEAGVVGQQTLATELVNFFLKFFYISSSDEYGILKLKAHHTPQLFLYMSCVN